MKLRIVLTLVLFTVVFAVLASAQQTYTKYDPAAGIHVPTFFTEGQACLDATQYKVYEPRDITRLGAWQEKLENNAAGVISYPFAVCVLEQTAMGHRIIKMPPNTPLFTQGGKVAADGRCGNEIFEIFLPPQPAPPPPPPPVVRKEPPPEPEPAPAPPTPAAEVPKHTCPTCEMVIELNPKSKIIRLTSKVTNGYASGEWSIDGKPLGIGSSILVSHSRLLKLAGKGEHQITFMTHDSEGHEVICVGTVKLDKKGRFWLFYLPGLNCLYAWTVDIKNWSLPGTVEKVGCLAAGAGIYFALPGGGAANIKYWVPGRP